jgi:methionyl-tRNA synthetase
MPWQMPFYYRNFSPFAPGFMSVLMPFLVPALIWSLVWKGLALYKAARNDQKGWFCVLLVLNTLGIVEIVYLLFFSNLKLHSKKRKA